jgi:iron-sulfur cluster repair protein YtfE (RIC family)
MNERGNKAGRPREQLLKKLSEFEKAIEPLHPNHRGPGDWKEHAAELHAATEVLRLYLADHLAPKELMDYRELPDTDAEVAAFAYELKMEHADLVRELRDMLEAIRSLESSLDRREDALRIYNQCKALAHRIARHAGGEEAQLGRYS